MNVPVAAVSPSAAAGWPCSSCSTRPTALLPGSTYDLTAFRAVGLVDALTDADVTTFADMGYQGRRAGLGSHR